MLYIEYIIVILLMIPDYNTSCFNTFPVIVRAGSHIK